MCNILNCFSPFWKQIWTASTVLILNIGQGLILGYQSILIAALSAPDSPIKTDVASISWLTASFAPAALTGGLLSCFFLGWLGRKKSFILFTLPAIIGLLLTYFAQNYISLLIGRMLNGLTSGGLHSIGIVSIAEYVHPKYRCMFLNLKTATITSGVAIIHGLGTYLHWRAGAIVILIPHGVAFGMATLWTESPSWYASKKRFDECEDSFYWIRGRSNSCKCEVKELIKAQRERLSNDKKIIRRVYILQLLSKITRKDFLKPLLISIIAIIIMEMSGRHVFPSYALQFMSDIIGPQTEYHYYYTVILDLIITIGAICSSALVRLIKVRTLLFTTGFTALTALFLACIYFFLVSKGIISNDRPWIVVLLLVVYFFFANLGCSPIPIALAGEIFPLEYRAVGNCMVVVFGSVILMVSLKIIPYLLIEIKAYGTFASFGAITALGLFILYFILPETKNKTLQEIEDYFSNRSVQHKNVSEIDDTENQKIINDI
ncbi:facilitated trehalose transporter Tret1-like [Achroia grisella]|uniref:facilitated trehalose transporter Tret1-like n=1 Tax=Achroia grisella TaxID=688607 RepID=UPI0027D1EB95|nr:facilitated trehalose transporter Tret1-like [Achroia grisella]